MTVKQIANRAKKIEALEAQKKALEEQITTLKEEIQGEMQESELLEAGEYVIRWTKVMSERFDAKAFKGNHAELFIEYVKNIESRRFTISSK